MKKSTLFVAALLAFGTLTANAQTDKEAAKAQKAAISAAEKTIKKAVQTYEMSIPNPQYGRKETNIEKLTEALALAKEAVTNEYSKDNAKAWDALAKIQAQFFNEYNEKAKADPSYQDKLNETSKSLVEALVKYDELAAKDPKAKPADLAKAHTYNQTLGTNPLATILMQTNALNGADNPDQQKIYELSNFFIETYTKSTLYSDFKANEEHLGYAKVFRAQAYASLPNPEDAKVEEYYTQVIPTQFGKQAVLSLAGHFQKSGNTEKYIKYLEMGVEKFPDEAGFQFNLFNHYVQDKNYDKAFPIADNIVANFPDRAMDVLNMKGICYFNMEKYADALEVFKQMISLEPDNVDALKNAGTAAAKLGLDAYDPKAKDNAKSKAYYEEAIKYLEHAREVAPDEPEKWAFNLQAAYNNTGQAAKAKEMEKYTK